MPPAKPSGPGIEPAGDDLERAFVQLSFEALEEFRFPQNEADLLPGIALGLQGYADEPADPDGHLIAALGGF